MSLTAADVAEIMRLVEQSSFDELTLEIDGIKLHLRRGSRGTMERAAAQFAAPVIEASQSQREEVQPPATPSVAADPRVREVRSPLLGTFYRAPRPGAAPFVEVGAAVEPDTVIAIIEVMKLMNTVRAGVRGTVTEILVSDGTLVEYDQPLLRVHAAE